MQEQQTGSGTAQRRPLPPGISPSKRKSIAVNSEEKTSTNGSLGPSINTDATSDSSSDEIERLKKEIERLKAVVDAKSVVQTAPTTAPTEPIQKTTSAPTIIMAPLKDDSSDSTTDKKRGKSLSLRISRRKSTTKEDLSPRKSLTMRSTTADDAEEISEEASEKEKKRLERKNKIDKKKDEKKKEDKKEKKEKKEKRDSYRKSVRNTKELPGELIMALVAGTGANPNNVFLNAMVAGIPQNTENNNTNSPSGTVTPTTPTSPVAIPQPQLVAPIVPTKKPSILPETDALPKETRLRNKCINEIIDTERDYITDLEIIKEVFVSPLSNILTKDESGKIFSNIEQILQFSRILCADLEKAAGGDESVLLSQIANCFKSLADYLKMYSVYCSNQKVSLETMELCSIKKAPFKTYLDEQMSNVLCKGLTLYSFLIKPIQRICKYPLLLRELIKYSTSGAEDYNKLAGAMEKIEMVVAVINERKRDDENMKKITDIQQLFDDPKVMLPSPTRRYVMDEVLKEMKSDMKLQEVRYFMFNDLILRAVPKTLGEGLACKSQIHLDALLVKDPEDQHLATFDNIFEILSIADGKKHTIFADNVEQKNKWTSAIKTIVNPRLEKEYKKFMEEANVIKQQESLVKEERLQAMRALQELKKDPKRQALPPPPADVPRVRSEILPKAPSAANNVPTRFSTTMVNNKANNTSDSNFFQRLRTSSAINKTVVAKQTKEGADPSRLTLSGLKAHVTQRSEPILPSHSSREENKTTTSMQVNAEISINSTTPRTRTPSGGTRTLPNPPSGAVTADSNRSLPAPPSGGNVLRLKCTYKDSRFVEISMDELQFHNLKDKINKKFGISGDSVWIRFKDDEDDLLTMVAQEDLIIALYEYHISELHLYDK